jgi:hypothetical protein
MTYIDECEIGEYFGALEGELTLSGQENGPE